MCRNIKTLFNYEPPASEDEMRASARQYVRKVSGFTHPSKANEAAFESAIVEITRITRSLIDTLETSAPPRNREIEARKAQARAAKRFRTG